MNLNFNKKMIACSFNDFCNNYFNNFIVNLSKKNELVLYTSQNTAKSIFENKIKIKILKKKYIFYNFFRIFSKHKDSSLQNFYFLENIIFGKFFFKFFYIFKYFFFKLGWLIDINLLRNFFFQNKINNANYDYLITDFRYNEVYSNYEIINYAKKNKIPIIVILFSWDNLFSEDVNLHGDYYYVGSEEMKKIMHNRHKIPLSKIFKHTSFQFLYLFQTKSKMLKYNIKEKYILYSCTFEESSSRGKEEFEIINYIGKFLIENQINLKLYVRPYPFFTKKVNLESKIQHPNIFIMDYGKVLARRKINDEISYMRFEKKYKDKLKLLNSAILHINILTTIGIESCLLNKCTLFLNFKKKPSFFNLHVFFNSIYFLSKFLDHWEIFNKKKIFITSYAQLDSILKKLLISKIKNFNTRNNNFIKNFFLN